MSNGTFPQRRFSVRRRSSSAVAWPRRGPMRIQQRPSTFIGGLSEGFTWTTAASQSPRRFLATSMNGNGRIFPSVRNPPSVFSNSSSMVKPAQRPSSSSPMKRSPGSPFPGRSLANAQIACRNLSRSVVDAVNSTRSLSPLSVRSSSSVSLSKPLPLPRPGAKSPPMASQHRPTSSPGGRRRSTGTSTSERGGRPAHGLVMGRQGSAKMKMLLPSLGRSSGVIALQREALPPVPVPATTYWRPSTA